MRRPPRPAGAPLLDRRTLALCLAQGLSVLAACLAALYFSLVTRGQPFAVAQSVTFATLVFADLGLIVLHRSWTAPLPRVLRTPNRAMWWVVLGGLAALLAALYVPPVRETLRFAAVPAPQLLAWALLGPLSVLWFERCKHA
jgi:Ca2+-transporting ATPase